MTHPNPHQFPYQDAQEHRQPRPDDGEAAAAALRGVMEAYRAYHAAENGSEEERVHAVVLCEAAPVLANWLRALLLVAAVRADDPRGAAHIIDDMAADGYLPAERPGAAATYLDDILELRRAAVERRGRRKKGAR